MRSGRRVEARFVDSEVGKSGRPQWSRARGLSDRDTDAIGRQIAIANYGTNGGDAFTRSATIPARSDVILVTTTEYIDAGEAYKTIDPADKEDGTEFDAAGRVTRTVENYTEGDPTTGGNDDDVTIEFTYTVSASQPPA